MSDADQRRRELRAAIVDLRERGLSAAARWAAEQLAGLPAPGTATSLARAEPAASDDDVYQLALSLFDAKVVNIHDAELRSVASVTVHLDGTLCAGVSTSSAHLGARARQQGCVPAVLRDIPGGRKAQTVGVIAVRTLCCTPDHAGVPESCSEQCDEGCAAGLLREERVEVAGALGKAQVLNKDLNALEQELGAAHRAGTADAFCLYLYGLILADRHGLPRSLCCPRTQPRDP